jgi:hypothetical protein
MKKQLIADIAAALHSYGYQVYIAEGRDYGFYTDGSRVVSFGGSWQFSVDFSGNYRALTSDGGRRMGTGWQIAKELSSITAEQAHAFVTASAPMWATGGEKYKLTTPEEHLKTYGKSSRYTLYGAPVEEATHYGLSRDELARRRGVNPSTLDDRITAICDNGSFHDKCVVVTTDPAHVDCPACIALMPARR